MTLGKGLVSLFFIIDALSESTDCSTIALNEPELPYSHCGGGFEAPAYQA
jgi:hypothetical protein